jgi:hypothetical protein
MLPGLAGRAIHWRWPRAGPVENRTIDSGQAGYGRSWLGAVLTAQVDLGVEPGINPDSHPWTDATDRAPEAR